MGGPWKIYLITTCGGSPVRLMPGEQDEADPTWSEDGNFIAFGGLPGPDRSPENLATMEIQVVDLKTHQLSKVSGSDGLYSPRWSPSGRYIVAFSPLNQVPQLFDFVTRKWVRLVDSETGYPSWSRDSKYIYMQDWNGGDPRIARLRLRDRKLEGIMKFSQLNGTMVGTITEWSGVALDGSPLLARDTSHREIYALKLQVP
jgi:Tol biopolymer transport system component